MVHWAWLVFAFFAGVVFGMFLIALAAVSRQDDDQKRKWWEE